MYVSPYTLEPAGVEYGARVLVKADLAPESGTNGSQECIKKIMCSCECICAYRGP